MLRGAMRSNPFDPSVGRTMLLLLLLTLWAENAAAAAANAAKNLTFGIINGASVFFQPIAAGFERRCSELGITSLVRDASPPPDEPEKPCWEVRMDLVREYIEQGVDAIAFKPCGPDQEMPPVFELMEQADIPVVTLDSDVLEVPVKRLAYIGTDNRFLGRTLAKLLRQLRPDGGTFAFLGDKVGRNEGFREEITRFNDRTGWGNWDEVEVDTQSDDYPKITGKWVDLMQYFADRGVTAMVSVVTSPMQHPNFTRFVDANRDKNITYIGADGQGEQLHLLHELYMDGLIGQLTFEMGSNAAQVLYDYITRGSSAISSEFLPTNIVAYNLIPLELPPLDVDENRIGNLKFMGFVFFGVVALSTIACLVWTFRNRSTVVVNAAQPFFLAMVAGGVLLMASSLIPLSFDDGDSVGSGDDQLFFGESNMRSVAICMSIPWLGLTGFTVTFSALLSKTLRVNTLFRAKVKYARIKVSVRDVLHPFFLLLTLNSAILIAWTVNDPLTYMRGVSVGTDYWNRVISTYGVCQSDNVAAYLAPLAVLNLSVICVTIYQVYQVREVKSVFSEAKYIGLTIGVLFQVFSTGIPVVAVVRDNAAAFYLVLSIVIFFLCMAMLLLIFLPKVIMAKKFSKMTEADQKRNVARSILQSSRRRDEFDQQGRNRRTVDDIVDFSLDFSSPSDILRSKELISDVKGLSRKEPGSSTHVLQNDDIDETLDVKKDNDEKSDTLQ